MSAPDLFTVPLPAHPTPTQLAAATRLAPHVISLRRAILANIRLAGPAGRYPTQLARIFNVDKVTVRARCSDLHRLGLVIRTAKVVESQHTYVAPEEWHPSMGNVPYRPHRGQR